MARLLGTRFVRRTSFALSCAWAALGASATAQTSIRERFFFDDSRDPFERTLGEEDAFGSALAGLGDLNGDGLNEFAVGAPGDHLEEGAVWIFSVRPSRQIAKFVKLGPSEALPFDLDLGDRFGSAVVALGDLDGNGVGDLAVGAPSDNDGAIPPISGAGAVYVLFLDANGAIDEYRKFSLTSGGFGGKLSFGDAFGAALAAPGDLDGNGLPDLIVGAPGDDDGGTNTGAAWVLFFGANRTVQDEQKISQLSGGMQGALTRGEGFGAALACLGDLDDDGVKDLAVGSVTRGPRPTEKLHVLFLNGAGEAVAQVGHANAGRAVAALGDVDGDGVEDLAAGAQVILLHADGTLKSQSSLAPAPFSGFSAALAAPGDTNSDGRPDLVVGSPGADARAVNSGALSFYEINANGVADPIHRDIDAATSGLPIAPLRFNFDRYGWATAPVGDLDNNGLVEIAVGAPLDNDGAASAGAVWIHFIQGGSGHRVEKLSASQSQLPLRANDQFGSDIASLGDLDGNGAEDLAVSAPFDDDGRTDAGAVYVLFLAQNGGVLRHQKISALAGGFSAPPLLSHFGTQLESLGDIDGDGLAELAVASLFTSISNPDNIWVLFLRSDGTVRAQTLLDRTLVPQLGTGTLARSVADLGSAPGGLHYLVTSGSTGSNLQSLWRLTLSASGQIQAGVRLQVTLAPSDMVGLGDLDGDGVADLASLLSNGRVEFRFMRANFSVALLQTLGGFELSPNGLGALGDLTGDGLPDLAFGGEINNHGRVLLLSLDGNVKWGFEHQDTADAAPLENGRQFPRPHPGRTFVVSSAGANLGTTAFDSTPNGPNQGSDLLVDRGNVLILQDSLAPTQSRFGIFDHPTDDPEGGLFGFDFPRLIRPLSIELADLDPFPHEGATVTLVDDANRTRLYDVPAGWTGLFGSTSIRKLALDTLAPKPGAGPYPAEAFETPGFDSRRVVRIEVELFDGGALDDLAYDPYP
ncbi:MAG: hypothetical protein EXS08_11965 [Planctomycetes bacterium]|nr:hypothetical protein [Planctomycetota bacterium]